MKIRLLIADDHRMVRDGIKAFLAPSTEYQVVGEAEDGDQAVALAAALRPDVILMDLVMPNLDGVEATQRIKQQNPQACILIITSFVEESRVIAAIKAGASGYVLKDASPHEIETAICTVYAGETAFPARITAILAKEISRPPAAQPPRVILTDREVEILKLVAQGLSNQDIAERLVLSVWTVRTYVTDILAKLHVENRTQAALFALRSGLVKLD